MTADTDHVDGILRAHADAAGRAAPDPEGWDRLVARLEAGPIDLAPPSGDTDAARGRGRGPLLGAAVVLVVVAVSAAVALVRSFDGATTTTPATTPKTEATADPATTDGDPATTDGDPTTGTEPTPETSAADPDPEVGRPEIDEATMPDGVVSVVDGDGDGLADVVRLSGIHPVARPGGGYRVPDPESTVLVPGSDVAPAAITEVDITADGIVVYLVGEEVWRVDPTSGLASGPVARGTTMAVSGDGQVLATVIDDVIRIHDVDQLGGHPVTDLATEGEVTGLALSHDGTQIARQRVTRAADGTITATAVDVGVVARLGDWVEVDRSSGVGLPAYMPDGHLAVGLGTTGTSVGHDEVRASEVGMVDLETGEVRWSVGGGGFSFTTFDASPDGRWVLVHQDGVVRAFAAVDGWLWDNGTVVQRGGMTDVAW
jgi:hypothetical protein